VAVTVAAADAVALGLAEAAADPDGLALASVLASGPQAARANIEAETITNERNNPMAISSLSRREQLLATP